MNFKSSFEGDNQMTTVRKKLILNLLIRNLQWYTSVKNIKSIFDRNKRSDKEIYKQYKKAVGTIVSNNNEEKTYIQRKLETRWKEFVEITNGSDVLKEASDKTGLFTYLDVGAGDALLTSRIGKGLGLSKGNVYAIDIPEWEEQKHNNLVVPVDVKYSYIGENSKMDFPDNTFNLITCYHSMHHFKDLSSMILEIKRVLKPGGYIVIREHNCDSLEMAKLIDIEHALYAIVLSNNTTYNKFIKEYYGCYGSIAYWDKVLGLTNINIKKLPTITQSFNGLYREMNR